MLRVTGPNHQRPFETFAAETVKMNHVHRDRQNFDGPSR
jgi:hypothetical protein